MSADVKPNVDEAFERQRLWVAYEAGAQFVLEHLRLAIPLREVVTDEQRGRP